MPAKIIDGKSLAQKIRSEIKKEIAELGITPGLAVILVGADPSSHLYVSLKEKACAEVGIHFEKYLFFATEPKEKIIAKIKELNADQNIHGIIVQLPLPPQFNENKIIAGIDPQKDADGFHPDNIGKLLRGELTIVPPVISGILKLIEATGEEIVNKKIAILANSETFAKPLAKILESFSTTHKNTQKNQPTFEAMAINVRQWHNHNHNWHNHNRVIVIISPTDPTPFTRDADIVITALGRPKFLTNEMIKEGAIVIDVGTTRLEDGTLVGDLDFESVSQKAGWITPVPGGVGPMTVAMLLKNVLELAKK